MAQRISLPASPLPLASAFVLASVAGVPAIVAGPRARGHTVVNATALLRACTAAPPAPEFTS